MNNNRSLNLPGLCPLHSALCLPASAQDWQATTAPVRVWTGVACSSNATKLVAVAYSGQIYTSADSGVDWTPQASNRNWQSVASSADGTRLVAVVSNGTNKFIVVDPPTANGCYRLFKP